MTNIRVLQIWNDPSCPPGSAGPKPETASSAASAPKARHGTTLGLTRSTVIDRGRRIGARRPPPGPPSMVEDPGRAPLPPGHPRTWGAIVAGSVLEGDPYPYPVFDI